MSMELILFVYPVLFIVGAVFGAVVNCYADRNCWTIRFRSPWQTWPSEFSDKLNSVQSYSKRRQKNKNRNNVKESVLEPFAKRWLDFIPIVGFLSMSRIGCRLEQLPEAERLPGLENRLFWLRPFFVELFFALGACWLFWWEVEHQMLRPEGVGPEPWETVVLRYGVHVVFFAFLLAASLIDIDDMIIPENLTVVGTLLGLTLATFLPQTLLPSMKMSAEIIMPSMSTEYNPVHQLDFQYKIDRRAEPLNLCSPNSSDFLWKSKPFQVGGTVSENRGQYWKTISLLWIFWCFAMLSRVWYFKLPFRKSSAIFCRYLKRTSSTKWYVGAACLLPITLFLWITYDPFWMKTVHHIGLLSALVGMVVGMSCIWATRIIGSAVLGREAMGFGDVTLMGMIGAFVGWQASILIFFLAPIAGMLLWILNAAVGRGREFPYGPYLCLATFLLVVFWGKVWTEAGPYYFELGWWIGVIMIVCLIMLGVLLGLWRWIRSRVFGV